MIKENTKHLIVDNSPDLINVIDPNTDFFACLRKYGVITLQKKQELNYGRPKHEIVDELLDYLQTRSEQDFQIFCRSLEESNQGHVVVHYFPGYSSSGFFNANKSSSSACVKKSHVLKTHQQCTQAHCEGLNTQHQPRLICIDPQGFLHLNVLKCIQSSAVIVVLFDN